MIKAILLYYSWFLNSLELLKSCDLVFFAWQRLKASVKEQSPNMPGATKIYPCLKVFVLNDNPCTRWSRQSNMESEL